MRTLTRLVGGFRRRPHPIYELTPPVPPPTYLQSLTWTGSAPAADPSLIVDAGDLDIEGTFTAQNASGSCTGVGPAPGTLGPGSDGAILFHATTPEGDISLRYETDFAVGAAFWLKVRGVDAVEYNENFFITGGTTPDSRTVNTWRAGDEIHWRAWYRPSTGQAGIRVAVNGVYLPDFTTTTTGGALATPTAVTVGATIANTTQAQTFTARFKAQTPTTTTPEFMVIGDSTLAPWEGGSSVTYSGIYPLTSVGHALYHASERWTRPGIGILAVPGDTCAGQQTKWSASPWKSAPSLKAVIVQDGVNDVNTGTPASVVVRLQALIDQIHTDRPDVKVLVAKLVPFGNSATSAQITWLLEFNSDIAGTGPNPVVRVDGRIVDAYATLDNGSAGYKPVYDYDAEHENNEGRDVIAASYRSALAGLGLIGP